MIIGAGIDIVMVPRRRRSKLPVLFHGRLLDGYVEVPVKCLVPYTRHHAKFCFATLGATVVHQDEGLPTGSAFSVFLQRGWRIFREMYLARNLDTFTARTAGHRIVRVPFCGCFAWILELRYADDVSQTAVVSKDCGVDIGMLQCLLEQRRDSRYRKLNGIGVSLEPGKIGRFIGLLKQITPHRGLLVRPSVTDDAQGDDDPEFLCLSGLSRFEGWYPNMFPFATLSGFASRAISLSSTRELAAAALTDYLELFLVLAHFPEAEVLRLSRQWDKAHPCAPVHCSLLASSAIARKRARQAA